MDSHTDEQLKLWLENLPIENVTREGKYEI